MISTLPYYASVIIRGPLPGAILSQPGSVVVALRVNKGVLK